MSRWRPNQDGAGGGGWYHQAHGSSSPQGNAGHVRPGQVIQQFVWNRGLEVGRGEQHRVCQSQVRKTGDKETSPLPKLALPRYADLFLVRPTLPPAPGGWRRLSIKWPRPPVSDKTKTHQPVSPALESNDPRTEDSYSQWILTQGCPEDWYPLPGCPGLPGAPSCPKKRSYRLSFYSRNTPKPLIRPLYG